MRIGLIGPSYTARSIAVADEELINWIYETLGSQGSIVSEKPYGGAAIQGRRSLLWSPGLVVFAALPTGPSRGGIIANGRVFEVAGNALYEIFIDGTFTNRGVIANDANAASLAFNGVQLLIVGGGQAYCFTLATNVLLNVTASLAGVPVQCEEIDTYFIVCFRASNKFQMSQVLDGTTWPGQLVNETSVFPDYIMGIKANHRELWVFGLYRTQPYQNTGSLEVFDVISGTMIEKGLIAPFAPCRADNSLFWVDQDERGGRSCWRSQGYTPQRVSTYAVEVDLASYSLAQVSAIVSFSYTDAGHIFWILYIPGSRWSWCYDVTEGVWTKRDQLLPTGATAAHWAWNHVNAFGKHLVGDWASGNIYDMSLLYLTDNGTLIQRVRQTPVVGDEMQMLTHKSLTIDIEAGIGPQPPLRDGQNNPRAPQVMLTWSSRGRNSSSEHLISCGLAGQYKVRAKIWRLGQDRYRVYRLVTTDPVPWVIVDGYLDVA